MGRKAPYAFGQGMYTEKGLERTKLRERCKPRSKKCMYMQASQKPSRFALFLFWAKQKEVLFLFFSDSAKVRMSPKTIHICTRNASVHRFDFFFKGRQHREEQHLSVKCLYQRVLKDNIQSCLSRSRIGHECCGHACLSTFFLPLFFRCAYVSFKRVPLI